MSRAPRIVTRLFAAGLYSRLTLLYLGLAMLLVLFDKGISWDRVGAWLAGDSVWWGALFPSGVILSWSLLVGRLLSPGLYEGGVRATWRWPLSRLVWSALLSPWLLAMSWPMIVLGGFHGGLGGALLWGGVSAPLCVVAAHRSWMGLGWSAALSAASAGIFAIMALAPASTLALGSLVAVAGALGAGWLYNAVRGAPSHASAARSTSATAPLLAVVRHDLRFVWRRERLAFFGCLGLTGLLGLYVLAAGRHEPDEGFLKGLVVVFMCIGGLGVVALLSRVVEHMGRDLHPPRWPIQPGARLLGLTPVAMVPLLVIMGSASVYVEASTMLNLLPLAATLSAVAIVVAVANRLYAHALHLAPFIALGVIALTLWPWPWGALLNVVVASGLGLLAHHLLRRALDRDRDPGT